MKCMSASPRMYRYVTASLSYHVDTVLFRRARTLRVSKEGGVMWIPVVSQSLSPPKATPPLYTCCLLGDPRVFLTSVPEPRGCEIPHDHPGVFSTPHTRRESESCETSVPHIYIYE